MLVGLVNGKKSPRGSLKKNAHGGPIGRTVYLPSSLLDGSMK